MREVYDFGFGAATPLPLAIAHGDADQLAQLLAEIDGTSRGLAADRLLVDVTPVPGTN